MQFALKNEIDRFNAQSGFGKNNQSNHDDTTDLEDSNSPTP